MKNSIPYETSVYRVSKVHNNNYALMHPNPLHTRTHARTHTHTHNYGQNAETSIFGIFRSRKLTRPNFLWPKRPCPKCPTFHLTGYSLQSEVKSMNTKNELTVQVRFWLKSDRSHCVVSLSKMFKSMSDLRLIMETNAMNPDQTASLGAVWSGFIVFAI